MTRQPMPEALQGLPRLDVRDGHPVVEVRDHNLWRNDPRTREILPDLEDAGIDTDAIYEGIVRDFWECYAPEAAREVGYDGTVYSAGRSSGWIFPDDSRAWHFLDYTTGSGRAGFPIPEADDTADDDTRDEYAEYRAHRDRFLRFAAAIKRAMETCETEFVDQLQAAHADLERRREECIVRGED